MNNIKYEFIKHLLVLYLLSLINIKRSIVLAEVKYSSYNSRSHKHYGD